MDQLSITLIIIIATAITSFIAFENKRVLDEAIFYPYGIHQRNEWHRFITSGFIHANFIHLAFNMYALYLFGDALEKYFLPSEFGDYSRIVYLAVYIGGMIVSDIPSYLKHRHDPTYRGLGASGAVAAVVFTCILLGPFEGSISLIFLPIPMPPVVFGVLYLIYSAYMGKRGGDNINHDAHFYGALFGLTFPIVLHPHIFIQFIDQIKYQL